MPNLTHTNKAAKRPREPEELRESYARLVRNTVYRAQGLIAEINADFTTEPPSSSDPAMSLGLAFHFPESVVRIDLHTRTLTGMADSTLRNLALFLPKVAESIYLGDATRLRAVALHYSARPADASAPSAAQMGVHVFYDELTPPNAVFLDMHRWGDASTKPVDLAAHIVRMAPAPFSAVPESRTHDSTHVCPSESGRRALTL